MKQLLQVTLPCWALFVLTGNVVAANANLDTIEIGQSITDVLAVLHHHGIKSNEGSLQLTGGDNDTVDVYFVLDNKNTSVAVFYSKSNKKVTGITLIFHPNGLPQKLYQSWLEAKGIKLEKDRSYSVHFMGADKAQK